MKNKEEKILSRRFLGKTKDFTDKKERNFETAHLKAYLKGYRRFVFGRDYLKDEYGNSTGMHYPKYHEVKQEYFYVNSKGERI